MTSPKSEDGRTAQPDGAAGSSRSATADAYASARDKVGTALSDAGDRAGAAYEDARAALATAAASTRDAAHDARVRASDGIQDNPVAAVVGGLVLGAVAAAVLPRTEGENRILGALGGRINDAARGAVAAGKSAGIEKLDELGLTPDRAQQTVSRLVGDVAKAATTAGSAAAASVREGGPAPRA